MNRWQEGKPPNETLVEVEHEERGIIRVRAMWGRDGMLPHWESEDRGILWGPSAFDRWRHIVSGNPASPENSVTPRRSAAPKNHE